MQISVKQMTGDVLTLNVEDGITVLELKKQIRENWAVPEDQQKLSVASDKLEDSQTMKDCHIQEGTQVDLFVLSWTEARGL
mmetsp:Transcript_10176/g.28397  ORF Transcript_10176/g.28397 Transcript_10176/m.28397 type:complete len:81 (-) Transcript_10176:217-459(-)